MALTTGMKRAGSDLSQSPRQAQLTSPVGQQSSMRDEQIFYCCHCLRRTNSQVPQPNPVMASYDFRGRLYTRAGGCLTCGHLFETCGYQCVSQKASDPIGPWILGLAARRTIIQIKLPWGEHSGWTYEDFRHLIYLCYPAYTCCECQTANPLRYFKERSRWMACPSKVKCPHKVCPKCEKTPAWTSPPHPQAPRGPRGEYLTHNFPTGGRKRWTRSQAKIGHILPPTQPSAGPSSSRPLPARVGTPATNPRPKTASPSPSPQPQGKSSSPPGRNMIFPRPIFKGKSSSPPAETRQILPWHCCYCLERGHDDCWQPNTGLTCIHIFNKGTGREFVCKHEGEYCMRCG